MDTQQAGSIRRNPGVKMLQARDLNWLLGQYLEACRGRVANPQTIVQYEVKLRWFTDWWDRVGPQQDWLLHQSDLNLFEHYLRGVVSKRTKRKLSWNSRNDVLRRLREALGWARRENYVDFDYSQWVPAANGAPPKRRAASLTDLLNLLEAAGQGGSGARDRTMLAIFIGMGLRRGEVTNLNVEDVVFEADDSGHAKVTGKRTRANADGQRAAAFDAATGRYLRAYLAATGYHHGPLFRGPSNQRLSDQGVYRAVKAAIARAGLDDVLQGCHDLRRAFATAIARTAKGQDAADRLRRQLGHSSYGMTTLYTLLDVDDIRVELVSPLMLPSDT